MSVFLILLWCVRQSRLREKKRIMEKGKGKPDDSLGNIYITYDVEMAQKRSVLLGKMGLSEKGE